MHILGFIIIRYIFEAVIVILSTTNKPYNTYQLMSNYIESKIYFSFNCVCSV